MSDGRRRAATAAMARMGELGLTQQELAERADVDPKTVGDLLRARRWPIARTRARVEKALGWEAGELDRIRRDQPDAPLIPPDLQRRIDLLSRDEREYVIERLTRRRGDSAAEASAN